MKVLHFPSRAINAVGSSELQHRWQWNRDCRKRADTRLSPESENGGPLFGRVDARSRSWRGASRETLGAHEGLCRAAQTYARMHPRRATARTDLPFRIFRIMGRQPRLSRVRRGCHALFRRESPRRALVPWRRARRQRAGELTGDALETSMEFAPRLTW